MAVSGGIGSGVGGSGVIHLATKIGDQGARDIKAGAIICRIGVALGYPARLTQAGGIQVAELVADGSVIEITHYCAPTRGAVAVSTGVAGKAEPTWATLTGVRRLVLMA